MAPEARPPTSPHQAAALMVAALAVGALGQAIAGGGGTDPSEGRQGATDAGAARMVDVAADAGPPPSPAARDLREGRPMDVNRASAADLELLPRIGPALAARIVESRDREGPFANPEELARVRGIGPRTVERLRPFVRTSFREPDAGEPDGGASAPVPAPPGVSAAIAAPEHPDG